MSSEGNHTVVTLRAGRFKGCAGVVISAALTSILVAASAIAATAAAPPGGPGAPATALRPVTQLSVRSARDATRSMSRGTVAYSAAISCAVSIRH